MTSLGTLLIKHGWITKQQLSTAIAMQREVGGRLGTCLLEAGAISEELLDRSLAEQLGVPAASAEDLRDIPERVSRLLPAPIAIRYRAIPFRATHSDVDVAMMEVDNLWLQDELSFIVGRRLSVYIANEARIVEALARYYRAPCSDRFVRLLERLDREGRTRSEPQPHPASRLVRPEPSVRAEEPASSAPEPSVRAAVQPEAPKTARRGDSRDRRPLSIPLSEREVESLGTARADPSRPPPPIAAAEIYRRDYSPEVAPDAGDAAAALSDARSVQQVGDALLAALSREFVRALLFKVTPQGVRGWLAHGAGLDRPRFEGLRVTFDEPSIFLNLREGGSFFLGVLPSMAAHLELAACWGRDLTEECAIFPIRVRDRLVALMYGDRGPSGLQDLDLDRLRRLAEAAALALERCIVEQKKRSRDAVGSD